jgi:S1-C subfamily serine protease
LQSDIVVTYEGQRVGDFDGLTALIALNRPKDVVTLQFVRNPEAVAVSRIRREEEPLGITAKNHELGCEVTEVAANSYAAAVGIQKGDVIHRLNNAPLENFQHLEKLFTAQAVGDPVMIDFARRLQLRTLQVELGEFRLD